jgi:quercetin dioxygenase-like cupin family protein
MSAAQVPGGPPSPSIDNDRVTVWEVTSAPGPRPAGDWVWVSLTHLGEVAFKPGAASMTGRGVLIVLKDKRVPVLENKSGYPNAFPRPRVKKLLENDRVVVWDYSWTEGEPSPMHFHDKDVVVTYVAEGALKSTAPDGKVTMNEFSAGAIRFNARDRVHTEELAQGRPRAIITELK